MRAAFLLRFLACVALVVSGLPLWAAVCKPAFTLASQASTSVDCKMACCAGKTAKAITDADCCPTADDHEAATDHSGSDHHAGASHRHKDHGCSLTVSVTPSAELVSAVPTFEFSGELLLAPAAVPTMDGLDSAEPLSRLRVGIAGLDSGPPQASPCLPDSGRSPPFSRL